MPHHTSSAADAIAAKLAERNVRMARVRERIASVLASRGSAVEPARHIGPFITVSRQHGAGASEVAKQVGGALGWSVIERELVDLVASHLQINPAMADLLDTSAANWLSDVLSSLMPNALVNRDSYTQELRRAIHLLAVHGDVIIVGHAAHLFLPRERGLAVRIVAEEKDRVARVRARSGMNEAQARREIARVDRARAHFVSRAFGREMSDPLLYDLVLNSSSLPLGTITELVVAAWRRKAAPAAWSALKAS